MSKLRWRMGALLLAAGLMTACTTTGVGLGETRGGGPDVNFTWTSDNATTGKMTAVLENTGQAFTGKFMQITSETRIDDLQPLWFGWHRRWGAYPYWGAGTDQAFITHYSGRVVANLESPMGDHMRCNFRLMRPSTGMEGGGRGHCQVPDGKTIDATFPAA